MGASTRASINLVKAAKAHAVLSGRTYLSPHDIKTIAPDVLRHRVTLSYEAAAPGKTADDLEKITSASIGAYMEHVNISEDKLKELLDAETWLSADEAVEMGFATEKAVSQASGKPSQSARDRFAEMWQKSRTPKAPPEPEETPMQKFFKSMAKRKDD